MANYPRVDAGNPYLLARYDGAVVDGKPWGKGGKHCERRRYPWAAFEELANTEDIGNATGLWERVLTASRRLGQSALPTSLVPTSLPHELLYQTGDTRKKLGMYNEHRTSSVS